MGGCRVKHFGSRVPADSGHLFLSDLHGGGEVEERIGNERGLGINQKLAYVQPCPNLVIFGQ